MSINVSEALATTKRHLSVQEEFTVSKKNRNISENRDILQKAGFSVNNVIGGQSYHPSYYQKFDTKHLFTTEEIRNFCEKYNLRFLDSRNFVAEVPLEAADKLEEFEKDYELSIRDHRCFVLAPPSSFRLKAKPIKIKNEDPLLFVRLTDGTWNSSPREDDLFYFIHAWGNDLSIWRRVSTILKSGKFLSLAIFIAALVFSLNVFKFPTIENAMVAHFVRFIISLATVEGFHVASMIFRDRPMGHQYLEKAFSNKK